jgi:hypothetical protein
MKTLGISPKVLADLFTSAAGYLLLKYGAGLDVETSAIIGKIIGTIAGVIAGPGNVVPKATA